MKVKVTTQSFLLRLSRSVYFVTYLFGFRDISFWSLLLNFQKGGAWQNVSPQILGSQRAAAGKDRGGFFLGGCSIYVKNKLKSEIFNGKKCL